MEVTTLDNTGPLLETKLSVPRLRRGLVARPRLIERLDRGAESKLTLVSAPTGFGKTTLLAEWLAAAPAGRRTTAWHSLGLLMAPLALQEMVMAVWLIATGFAPRAVASAPAGDAAAAIEPSLATAGAL